MEMISVFFFSFLHVMEHRWNETDRGKQKYSGKTLSQATLSTTNPTRDRTRVTKVGDRLTVWATAQHIHVLKSITVTKSIFTTFSLAGQLSLKNACSIFYEIWRTVQSLTLGHRRIQGQPDGRRLRTRLFLPRKERLKMNMLRAIGSGRVPPAHHTTMFKAHPIPASSYKTLQYRTLLHRGCRRKASTLALQLYQT
jgi:hypothetical protein